MTGRSERRVGTPVGVLRERGVSGGESHLESTESVADERERITVKPRKQNAGEGGNLRGRGNSAGAGVRYTERPLLRVRLCGACESA